MNSRLEGLLYTCVGSLLQHLHPLLDSWPLLVLTPSCSSLVWLTNHPLHASHPDRAFRSIRPTSIIPLSQWGLLRLVMLLYGDFKVTGFHYHLLFPFTCFGSLSHNLKKQIIGKTSFDETKKWRKAWMEKKIKTLHNRWQKHNGHIVRNNPSWNGRL